MPYYSFECQKTKKEYDKQYSFKEFDEIKSGKLNAVCEICNECHPEMIMGGVGVFIYMSDPRTLGTLAERNSKFRIPEEKEKKERELEKAKAEGKHIPKDFTTWWDKPERPKVDMKERKEIKKEHVAKHNSRKRPARNSGNTGNKNK